MVQAGTQQARQVFSREKTIESNLLNRLGVQVLRCVAARALYSGRRPLWVPSSPDVALYVRELERNGFVQIEDFLPADLFESLSQSARELLSDEAVPRTLLRHGSNDLEVVDLTALRDERARPLQGFFADERLHGLATAVERRPLVGDFGVRTLERLKQRTGEVDEQSELHSDIFFTVHKAWLYLTDVTEEDGPLVYVKGSHRLSLAQAKYLYLESCGRNQGSRRILIDEVQQRGLQPTVITARRNTLVMANTMGYHCRQQGWPPGHRIALHLSLRGDPFSLASFRPPKRDGTTRLIQQS